MQSMAQGLYLSQRMALQQVLAPQLQQSLALLQAPTLELQAMVQQELANNVTLEEIPPESEHEEKETLNGEETPVDPAEPPADLTFESAAEQANGEPVDDFQAEIEKLLQLDQEWRDHYSQTNVSVKRTQEDDDKRQFMFDSLVANTSLQEDLLSQLRLSELNEDLHSIAEMLIGNIDDHGYLQASVEELASATNIPQEKILEVLKVIQSFDPPGAGARDLRECLLLQLERKGQQNSLEYRIISDHMDALQKRRLPEIARAFEIYVDEVQDAVENIAKLDPHPGRIFAPDDQQYVVPEVFVQKVGDDYVVTSNNEHIPHLRNHFVFPASIANGCYETPQQPGASCDLKLSSAGKP